MASVSAVTRTMSPSITTTASTSGPSAFRPGCNEPLVGPVESGLTAKSSGRSFSSARRRSASWPITTTTGDSPAPRARFAARRIKDSPSSTSSILFLPMRRDAPAARITPATRGGSVARGMNGGTALPQRPGPASGAHREHLRNHGECHLLRAVGPDVQAHGPVHPRLVHRPLAGQVSEDALRALARAQHYDISDGRLQEGAHVRLIVREVVIHHDGVTLGVERQRRAQLV